MELNARQRLRTLPVRHSRVYRGKSRWTQSRLRWLDAQQFDNPVQQVVCQEYVDAVLQAQARTVGLEAQMHEVLHLAASAPRLRP